MSEQIAGIICLILSVYLFWRAINYLKLVRIIEDTPRSKIVSAPQGMVELKGQILPEENQVLMVPLKNIPCVWYRYIKTEEYTDDEYPEPEIKESHQRFYIADHTGKCTIDPVHAEIHSRKEYQEYKDSCKHEVSWIGVADHIYVLGWLHTLHPSPQTDDLIVKRDGKEHSYGRMKDKLECITKPPHNWLPFIISTHFENKLASRFRALFISWGIGSLGVLFFAGTLITK